MDKLDQNRLENKETTLLSCTAVQDPTEAEVELERQCYDVRHIMRLQIEGKPFKTHFDDPALLQSRASDDWPLAGSNMLKYLGRMKREVEGEIGERLGTMPFYGALRNDELVWWWGTNDEGLKQMVLDWFGHVRDMPADVPFPTPAYWLLRWRPPVPFDLRKSPFDGLPYGVLKHMVEGREWPPAWINRRLSAQKRAA